MARKVPLAVAIFLAVGGSYLLATGRERPWGDARIVYEVAIAFERGTVAIRTEWPPMSHRGPDGKIYSQYALGPSLVSAPGRWLRDHLADERSPSAPLAKVVTGHLGQAVMGALNRAVR